MLFNLDYSLTIEAMNRKFSDYCFLKQLQKIVTDKLVTKQFNPQGIGWNENNGDHPE